MCFVYIALIEFGHTNKAWLLQHTISRLGGIFPVDSGTSVETARWNMEVHVNLGRYITLSALEVDVLPCHP